MAAVPALHAVLCHNQAEGAALGLLLPSAFSMGFAQLAEQSPHLS